MFLNVLYAQGKREARNIPDEPKDKERTGRNLIRLSLVSMKKAGSKKTRTSKKRGVSILEAHLKLYQLIFLSSQNSEQI